LQQQQPAAATALRRNDFANGVPGKSTAKLFIKLRKASGPAIARFDRQLIRTRPQAGKFFPQKLAKLDDVER
jgi:hypothetical protein